MYFVMMEEQRNKTEDGMKRAKRLEVMLEFLVFGIVVGVIEDIIAVRVTTGDAITWKMVGIIVLIAIPFAVLGEIFADNINFAKYIRRYVGDGRSDGEDE